MPNMLALEITAHERKADLHSAFSWSDAINFKPYNLPSPDSIAGKKLAVIIYTSGTTGLAKGIMLSHEGIIANVNAAIQSLTVFSSDNFITVLPLHHTYASTCTFLSPIASGACMTFIDKLTPSIMMKHIKASNTTFMIGVPLLFDKVKQGIRSELKKLSFAAKIVVNSLFAISAFFSYIHIPAGKFLLGFLRKKAGLNTVRLGVAGGGPLAWDTAYFFELLGFNLVQGYGMSENGPLIAVNLPEYKNNRSVGFAVKNTNVRIADPSNDGVGEIQVSSPSLMVGYLDNDEATQATITQDGWLRTGDLGYIDKHGFIFITGRSKNIIVTEGGKNVYPEEIELLFEGSEWIKEVLVMGRRVSAKNFGEEIIAVCVPDWDKIEVDCKATNCKPDDKANDVVRSEIQRVNKELQSFMKITDFVIRRDEFEKTSTKKIRRFMYSEYKKPLKI